MSLDLNFPNSCLVSKKCHCFLLLFSLHSVMNAITKQTIKTLSRYIVTDYSELFSFRTQHEKCTAQTWARHTITANTRIFSFAPSKVYNNTYKAIQRFTFITSERTKQCFSTFLGVAISTRAGIPHLLQPIRFHCKRPFLYYIKRGSTIVFAGQYYYTP